MKKYPVLQSGFVALSDANLSLPEVKERTFEKMVLGKDVDNTMNTYHYSKDITTMFQEWMADSKIMLNFEWREKLLCNALRLLGGRSIWDFIDLQNEHASFSKLHKEFIVEMLTKVLAGQERKLEAIQWARLLYPTNGDKVSINVGLMKIDLAKGMVPKTPKAGEDEVCSSRMGELDYFIQDWVAQKDGYSDLLKTLFCIFGQRDTAVGIG